MNAQFLGDFDKRSLESIVKFYVAAEWYLSALKDYRWSLENELQRNKTVPSNSAPVKLLGQLRKLEKDVYERAPEAQNALCEIAEIYPKSLPLAVQA